MSPRSTRYHKSYFFFFFNDTATTEIYTLSLHDALPISLERGGAHGFGVDGDAALLAARGRVGLAADHLGEDAQRVLQGVHRVDRKSTRLNSSHLVISYAVFCLKKKKIAAGSH